LHNHKGKQLNKYQEALVIKSNSLHYSHVYPCADSLIFFILYLGLLNFCLVYVFCSEPYSWIISLEWQRGRFCECYVSAVISRAVTSLIQWWLPDRHTSTCKLWYYTGSLYTLFVSIVVCLLLLPEGKEWHVCVCLCVWIDSAIIHIPHTTFVATWINAMCYKFNSLF